MLPVDFFIPWMQLSLSMPSSAQGISWLSRHVADGWFWPAVYATCFLGALERATRVQSAMHLAAHSLTLLWKA